MLTIPHKTDSSSYLYDVKQHRCHLFLDGIQIHPLSVPIFYIFMLQLNYCLSTLKHFWLLIARLPLNTNQYMYILINTGLSKKIHFTSLEQKIRSIMFVNTKQTNRLFLGTFFQVQLFHLTFLPFH